jgi:hypothetical protein
MLCPSRPLLAALTAARYSRSNFELELSQCDVSMQRMFQEKGGEKHPPAAARSLERARLIYATSN